MGMELTHTFTVPGPVDQTWERFGDIASLAECFPGAQVTSVSGDTFEGTVKVKLGPIALVYSGSGTFVSKDEDAHTFAVEAKGRDKRGNGTAGANVTVAMAEAGDSTSVEVKTDLSITGKPAQFGRGVMQDVSDKLLGQFVACLEQRSGVPEGDSGDSDAGPASVPTGAAASAAPGEDQDAGPASAPAPETVSGGQAAGAASGNVSYSPPATAGGVQSTGGTSPGAAGSLPADDALDLGATLLPVLARSYWKQALGGLAVVALLVWLVRRLL